MPRMKLLLAKIIPILQLCGHFFWWFLFFYSEKNLRHVHGVLFAGNELDRACSSTIYYFKVMDICSMYGKGVLGDILR